MPKPKKIPEQQLRRVKSLEEILRSSAVSGDLKKAKLALNDLRLILENYDQDARLNEAYLHLYEAAMEAWDLDTAKRGFRFVRERVNSRTRLFLEATTLLAICHLRERDLFAAEPLMAEVLKNDQAISSPNTRRAFRREVIERFDQEGALAALADQYPEMKTEAEVHEGAIALLQSGGDEEDLLNELGAAVPQQVKDFMLRVDDMSKRMLPDADRLLLPSPREVVRNKHAGRIVFGGIKRRLYRRICDQDSDVYQAWVGRGIGAVLSESYIASAVLTTLSGELRITLGAVAIPVVAMVMKRGINNFCDRNRPRFLMSTRRRGAG